MVTKIALAAAALVAIAPAAITVLWPHGAETGAVARPVELHGPIASFTQSLDKVQVRLVPAATDIERNARSQVIIRDEHGDELAIPLKHGQTWANADLPAALIDAKTLEVSVD